mmetsp:Transcript_13409/g.34779  ORF Transcript_13409/g.34779 Transcript_13409/m.34779 type:complete len:650 (-) Transcript_13409:193-2142(-)|eukprot:jgi/Tetstr1/449359/TSEL_003871.t1
MLNESDIDWAELDGRLRRLSASGERKWGSVEDELEVRTFQARELRRLASELRNRLRQSEKLRESTRRDGGRAVAEVDASMSTAVDGFQALEETVAELEQQVRYHAVEHTTKDTIIQKQAAEMEALRAKVGRQERELCGLRAELEASKMAHLQDIRAAQSTCDSQRSKLARETGQVSGLRAELQEAQAEMARLQVALCAQKTLAREAGREAAGLRADATAVQETHRLYEDAKYEASRFRQEAARLAKLLGQEPRAELVGKLSASGCKKSGRKLKAVSKMVRTGGGFANFVNVTGEFEEEEPKLRPGIFGNKEVSLDGRGSRSHKRVLQSLQQQLEAKDAAGGSRLREKAVGKLRKEWAACPGGLAFIGEDGGRISDRLAAVGKKGTAFAGYVQACEGGELAQEGSGWVPARAIDVVANFRRSFCPSLPWALLEMLLLVLDKVWQKREGRRLAGLQQRHRAALRAARRKANHVSPMLIVRQKDRINALERQLASAKAESKLQRRLGQAGGGGRSLAGVALEKQLALARQLEVLGVENLQLRDVLRKAASAVDQVQAIHREGAAAQARQAVAALDGARERLDALMQDAKAAVAAAASVSDDTAITAAMLKAHLRLSEGVAAVMRACEAEAQIYHPLPALGSNASDEVEPNAK